MVRLSTALLKGAGLLVLALVLLGVIATIVSVVLSIVATVVAAVVTLAVLAVFVLAAVGLVSLLRDGEETPELDGIGGTAGRTTEADPEDRLRSQYVDGKLDDDEFERELDRVLEADDIGRSDRLESEFSHDGESTTDRTRLWDR